MVSQATCRPSQPFVSVNTHVSHSEIDYRFSAPASLSEGQSRKSAVNINTCCLTQSRSRPTLTRISVTDMGLAEV